MDTKSVQALGGALMPKGINDLVNAQRQYAEDVEQLWVRARAFDCTYSREEIGSIYEITLWKGSLHDIPKETLQNLVLLNNLPFTRIEEILERIIAQGKQYQQSLASILPIVLSEMKIE